MDLPTLLSIKLSHFSYLGYQFESIVTEVIVVAIEEWPCDATEGSICLDVALYMHHIIRMIYWYDDNYITSHINTAPNLIITS